jgi:DNA repair exonuclease SbcCD ATPase subunit
MVDPRAFKLGCDEHSVEWIDKHHIGECPWCKLSAADEAWHEQEDELQSLRSRLDAAGTRIAAQEDELLQATRDLEVAREALCQIANGIPGACLHATEALQAIAVERQSPIEKCAEAGFLGAQAAQRAIEAICPNCGKSGNDCCLNER